MADDHYLIKKGCIRLFFIDKNGHEKTRYVMLDNHIGTALTSFISQKPSIEFIEALDIAGYIIILAKNLDEATKIAKKCPILNGQNTSVEIRETATPEK
ncbi:MAG: hypothetical protein JNK66_06280 [Chitinophagales bacterium]|nr:hypothetical protein [Chitinophagales bacterium]